MKAKETEFKQRLVTAEELQENLRSFMPEVAVPSLFTIGAWARIRRIPSIRTGRRVLYDPQAVERTIRGWESKAR